VLDADGYLFIADSNNNRIVGSGPYGFRCVAGCMNMSGSTPTQLYVPRCLGFDSYGNIFVIDAGNGRIQKFVIMANSCGKCYIYETEKNLNTAANSCSHLL
jgi:hypothetical protein